MWLFKVVKKIAIHTSSADPVMKSSSPLTLTNFKVVICVIECSYVIIYFRSIQKDKWENTFFE